MKKNLKKSIVSSSEKPQPTTTEQSAEIKAAGTENALIGGTNKLQPIEKKRD